MSTKVYFQSHYVKMYKTSWTYSRLKYTHCSKLMILCITLFTFKLINFNLTLAIRWFSYTEQNKSLSLTYRAECQYFPLLTHLLTESGLARGSSLGCKNGGDDKNLNCSL